MILPSNSSPLTKPDNIASKYIVDFQTPINLDGEWQVGLTDFTFIYKPITITKGTKITCHRTENIIETASVTIKNDKIYQDTSYRYHYMPMYYENGKCRLTTYLADFTLIIRKQESEKIIRTITSKNKELELTLGNGEYNFEMKYNYRIPVFENYLFKKDFTVENLNEISKYFQETNLFKEFNINKNLIEFEINNKFDYLNFDISLSKILGFEENIFVKNKLYTSKNKIEFDKGLEVFYIYSNIVEPIIVDGSRAPLLKSVWISNKYKSNDRVNINIDSPMYVPVCLSSINNVEVNIRNFSGEIIDFGYGSKTSLTLHFRKNDN
jgi:hypothetical protein